MNLGPAELLIVTSSSTSDKARGKFRTFNNLMDVKPFLFRSKSLAIKTHWVGQMMAQSCNICNFLFHLIEIQTSQVVWDYFMNCIVCCWPIWTIMLDPLRACQKNCKNVSFKISNCKNHTSLPNHHWQNVHNQYKQEHHSIHIWVAGWYGSYFNLNYDNECFLEKQLKSKPRQSTSISLKKER